MKSFLTVFRFELATLLKRKSFLITTGIVVVCAFILLSIPRFSTIFGNLFSSNNNEVKTMVIYDEHAVLKNDANLLKESFVDYTIQYVDSEEALKQSIEKEEAEAGFVISSINEFAYYVKNSSLMDTVQSRFEEVLKTNFQNEMLKDKGYDPVQIRTILQQSITSNIVVLGTDGSSNYFYTYILIFILYMMILAYGAQIGVNVASEKSNRSIEILVTSCSSNAMIFGKVLAGAVAGIVQTAIMLGSVVVAYKVNADVWGHGLDKFFSIPLEVVVVFALFGTLGYLLFSFIFGAIGAMCSKSEEVNGATLPIQMIVVVGFFASYMILQAPDSLLSQILCYIPFTSYMSMFVAVAMGVSTLPQIIISFVILLITVILMGMLGARLYRRATLSYGNKVNFATIMRMLKSK